jgi:serine protease Do
MFESMKIRLPGPMTSAVLLIAGGAAVGGLVAGRAPVAKTGVLCDGEYADSLQQLTPRARDIEQGPRAGYTFLIRSTAKYECPFFGPDGKLRRRLVETVEHGTAFAYEVSNGETFLLTNEHVAAWPEVTDAAHKVDGVQEGCKRLEERLRIVHDEHDNYESGHIPLSRVVLDPPLDAAILKASQRLPSLPYRIGKSAALRQGNAVQVRGFPLGLLHAVNTGKVVNPYDLDQEQGWEHTDFVIDALLSEGNSGSPVLALSCKTGELELVGMYHAGYKGHSALNVVVGIDQLREFMVKRRRVPRAPPEGSVALGTAGRKRLREALAAGTLPLFEFGGLYVIAEPSGEAFLYHFYAREFPIDDRRLLIIEDRPAPASGPAAGGFGELGRLWVRSESGAREWPHSELGAEERELLVRTADSLRVHMTRVPNYRRALSAQSSADERRRGREWLRTIERSIGPARELTSNLVHLAERLGPARATPLPAGVDAGAAAPLTAGPPAPPLRVVRATEQ